MTTAKNDITGDLIKSRSATEAYREGWERIFGRRESPAPAEQAAPAAPPSAPEQGAEPTVFHSQASVHQRRYYLELPIAALERLGWGVGTMLELVVAGPNRLELRPLQAHPASQAAEVAEAAEVAGVAEAAEPPA
jgi:bifunctional DNA-binding transcriptional regulator/antitoxin component of YhaV-PrlF toxin-antitoxin module